MALTEEELEELIEKTERQMIGVPPPSQVDLFKQMPGDEGTLGTPERKPSRKAIRTFILLHGRAPTEKDLEKLC